MSTRLKKFKGLVLFLIVWFCGNFSSKATASLILIKNGKPFSKVVISKESSLTEKYAAQELQKYLKKISGVELEIVSDDTPITGVKILIGKNKWTSSLIGEEKIQYDADKIFQDEPFIIKTDKNALILKGNGDRGTLYSIYTFLEILGCRFYEPGEDGEEIPEKKDIVIENIDKIQKPDFEFRQLFCDSHYYKREEIEDWLLKNKLNSKGSSLIPEEKGGSISISGGHSFFRWLSPEKYFSQHPEYFPLKKGKRVRNQYVQVCTTNPEVIEIFAQNIKEYLKENPQTYIISLCPNDGTGWCECENCIALEQKLTGGLKCEGFPAEYAITDRLHYFLNQIIEKVRKDYPNVLFCTYVYANYGSPPVNVQISPFIIPVFCHTHYYGCYSHTMEDPNCEANRKFREYLEGWSKITKRIYVYMYTWKTLWAHLPRPIIRNEANYIKYLKKMGVKGYQGQSSFSNWAHTGLQNYVISKMLWNSALNIEELLKEYYEGYYKKAKEPMWKFYETLETSLKNSGIHLPGISNPNRDAPMFVTPAVIKTCKEYLKDAKELAKDDKKIEERVRRQEILFKYAELYLNALNSYNKFNEEKKIEYISKAKENLDKLISLIEENKKFPIFNHGGEGALVMVKNYLEKQILKDYQIVEAMKEMNEVFESIQSPSYLAINNLNIPADGISNCQITLILKKSDGSPRSNEKVTLFTSRPDKDKILTPAISITDKKGMCFWQLNSAFPGTTTIYVLTEKGETITRYLNKEGLVSYWSFDEKEGDICFDYSGKENNGELKTLKEEKPKRISSIYGLALNFNSSDSSFVEIPHNEILNITNKFSLEGWVKPDTMPYTGSPWNRTIVSNGGRENYALTYDTLSKKLMVMIRRQGTAGGSAFSYIPDSQWYYLAGTFDGEFLKIYLNGKLINTGKYPGSFDSTDENLFIGQSGNARFFNGAIDEVKIYNRPLSEEEINNSFKNNCTINFYK